MPCTAYTPKLLTLNTNLFMNNAILYDGDVKNLTEWLEVFEQQFSNVGPIRPRR